MNTKNDPVIEKLRLPKSSVGNPKMYITTRRQWVITLMNWKDRFKEFLTTSVVASKLAEMTKDAIMGLMIKYLLIMNFCLIVILTLDACSG